MKLLFCTILISSLGYAVTPEEIRSLALERSSLIAANDFEARALRSEAELRGKWTNPQILGQFGTLKAGDQEGSTTEVSFTQPIAISDKFSLRKEAAQLAASQQKVQSEYFRSWVAHQAVLSAWRVQVRHELFKHGQERTKRLGIVKSYMETRPRVSVRHRVELSLIGALLLQLAKEQDEKAHNLALAIADLEFWTGKRYEPGDINFQIPDPARLSETSAGSAENDPELRKVKLDAKLATMEAELARKERRPDLFIGAGYRVENVSPVNHFSYGIVGLNIPIWDTGSSRVESANARALRSEKLLEESTRQARLRLTKQTEEVKFQLAQVKRFSKTMIPRTEDSIEEAERGFKQGVLDVNTFLQAETHSHELIDQVWLSWIGYLEDLSDLTLLQGRDIRWENP